MGAHVALAGCGGGDEPGRLVTETVGTGPQTATIVRPAGDERRPVVLFLHGWGATRPRFYRPWIDHLAREGNAVIYPRYQDSVVDPPAEVLGNVLAGVRQAFARIEGEYRLRTAVPCHVALPPTCLRQRKPILGRRSQSSELTTAFAAWQGKRAEHELSFLPLWKCSSEALTAPIHAAE